MSEEAASQEQVQPEFSVQRIYMKDSSFEAPSSPSMFTKEWAPHTNMDLNARTSKLNDEHFEVVLTITVTVTNAEETAFLIEVQQAGLFRITGLEGQQLQHALGAFCPNMLFPYAREAVDSLAVKGGFHPLMLAPVNFDSLFAEQMQKQQQAAEGQETH